MVDGHVSSESPVVLSEERRGGGGEDMDRIDGYIEGGEHWHKQ